jgi:hypothetical protein
VSFVIYRLGWQPENKPTNQSYQSFSVSLPSILQSGIGPKLIIRHYEKKIRLKEKEISQKLDRN